MLALALAASVVLAEVHPVPAWVPRTVDVGLFVLNDTVSVQGRLAWEVGLYEAPRNHLVLLAEVGTSTLLARGPMLQNLWQHLGLLGFGYRSTRELWHWGFHFVAGPLWYRAEFAPHQNFAFESRVLGYSEGRVQVGLKAAPNLVLGLYLGFASAWTTDIRYQGSFFLGGPMFGLFADWR
jgi:hypothetical protein